MIDDFQFIHLSEVDSTNNFAANLIKEGKAQNNMVIMADYQSKGKGQMGNKWVSEVNLNLTFSIIKQFDRMSVSQQAILTWITSLSLVQLLEELNVKAKVKWPNDIYVGGKKIAGILIENQLSGEKIIWSVLGIGLNVNQSHHKCNNATSLLSETGKKHELIPLVRKIQSFVAEKFRLPMDILRNEYNSKLHLRGEKCFFEDDQGVFAGEILEVNDSGYLTLQKNNGDRFEYGIKELIYRSDL